MAVPIVISDQRDGRNGVDSPIDPSFPRTQCVEALNVHWADGALGTKRGGSDNVALTGGTAPSSGVQTLIRHMPAGDETAAELWLIDGAGVTKRLTGGVNWADATLADAWTGNKYEILGISFNGKLYLAGKTAQARLHCYDPLTGNVRRVGLAPPTAAPTLANSGGGGAYAATGRYARVRWLQLSGTTVIRRSEAGPASTLFTPSGANLSWRITQPAVAGEGETHWEIEVSLDNATWNVLYGTADSSAGAAIAIGTTFKDDTTATTSFSSYSASDLAGTYTVFPSMKFLLTDGNRLIGMGSYDSSEAHQSRIWYSPVLGSLDKGDDERRLNRLTQKNIIDLNEGDGGAGTGLGGVIKGVFWAFKYRSITKFIPTGDDSKPYLPKTVSKVVGAINQQGIVLGEDAAGAPVVAFLSPVRGPYWIGPNGLERIGRDVEDIWRGLNGYSGVNLNASVVCHGQFYPTLGIFAWWIATGASTTPDTVITMDVSHATRRDRYGVRGGWAVWTGDAAAAYCSALFANTLGASMSKDLKPYIGRTNSTIYKLDTTAQNDNGVAFQSYTISRSVVPTESIGHNFTVGETELAAKAQSGATIRQTIIRDFGYGSKYSDQPLDAKKSETRVLRKFGAAVTSELGVIQVQLGDPQALSQKWSLDALFIPVEEEGSATK